MTEAQNKTNPINQQQVQNGALFAAIFALSGLIFLSFLLYLVFFVNAGNLNIVSMEALGISVSMFIVNLTGFALLQRGRLVNGAWIVYVFDAILFPISVNLIVKDVHIGTGIVSLFLTFMFIAWVFPKEYRTSVMWYGSATLFVIAGIEIWDPSFRVTALVNSPVTGIGLIALATAVLIVFFIQRATLGNIRSKIAAGILLTGILSLSVLTFYSFSRTSQLVNTVADRFAITVNLLAEEQLVNTVTTQASEINNILNMTVTQVQGLVSQLERLKRSEASLSQGSYWDANDELFPLSDGQYINNLGTPSSIFVPSFVELTDSVKADLNTTVYLDFSAPFLLKSNPQIKAVYYTNEDGVIIYYPNNRLGANIPHDYDGRNQPTYYIASPLFDTYRQPRWSSPRRDPAAPGLIISVSTPLYVQDGFRGIMVADFQLNRVARTINDIHVGQTGYAFLIDNDGHIIAMPPEGYKFFGMEPEVLEGNASPTQTIFTSNAPLELQQIPRRMVEGGSGVLSTVVNGVDIFIAYAPVANNDFSLGVIVPVDELTQPLIATRTEIARQTQLAIRSALIILVLLMGAAVLSSLILGQVISAPIVRLTQTANHILEGDLSAQADVRSRDETGTLAQAFNAMTSRLRATFAGLEKNIEERTAELMHANERNERRARQFQSIAQVARTISSTLDLDSLLQQITTVISREFGFYHVGVFLLDAAKEYAVLSAANSEGGQRMLAREHRLKVGEKGLVGFVSSTGRPRVALDTGADAVFFNNPDLPETHSEIAFPLRAGDEVIGVLDVQSTETNAFSQEDVSILSTLADQVSIAIQNARQNQHTQRALAEADALSRQFVQAGWGQVTKRQKILGIHRSVTKSTMLYSQKGENVENESGGTRKFKSNMRGAVLSLPIKLRGEVIGTVDVNAPDNRQWNQDEIDIVTAIIERAAIAMENARLLTETLRRASKERTIGEISARISAQSEVDDLLKTAAQELNRNLPNTEISIQFRREETE